MLAHHTQQKAADKRWRVCFYSIIDGSIADSTSLNLYTYVNGNPISFVDPFGLSADRGNNGNSPLGAIPYAGNIYPIYVPNHLLVTVEKDWQTVDTFYDSDPQFDLIKFLSGIELEDLNGEDIYAGNVLISNGYLTDKSALKKMGALSLFTGVLNSFSDSLNIPYIRLEFQECGDERRVIVSTGSSDAKKLYSQYADGIAHSTYFANGGNGVAANAISGLARSLYYDLTGNKLNVLDTYDIQITVDQEHRNNPDASYLWIAEDGTVMETPIIYSDDKVEIINRGFAGFGYESLITVPLGGSSPVAPVYQALFDKYR